MVSTSLEHELLRALQGLADSQVSALIQVARAMRPDAERPEYVEANDPAIGLISGPTDLAERSEDILSDEFDSRSGWTQKKDQSYTSQELLMVPVDERNRLVAAAFEAAKDEDFEIFDAYSEEDFDD
jgi:hypothetical protein